jgi:hypothetical protein
VCQDACLTNSNTVQGDDALFSLTTGAGNTAIGFNALFSNTKGNANTAIGEDALLSNTRGNANTAIGEIALVRNTSGKFNTAEGVGALWGNSSGDNNTGNGFEALFSNGTGSGNTAIGYQALLNSRKSNNNIALGILAGSNLSDGDNNIDIGNSGVAGEANTIRIGTEGTQTATYVAGIYGQVVAPATGTPVLIDGNGRLGTMLGPISSARRFKHDIKAMDKASESILALQPVTFHYKKELDPDGIPQFGLVAEEVEKVNPDLVARDEQGKPYTVRYEAVNAMLLNEFLKEHRKVESLEKAVAEQQKENAAMRAMLKEQAAHIRAVSAALQATKPSPRVVANGP